MSERFERPSQIAPLYPAVAVVNQGVVTFVGNFWVEPAMSLLCLAPYTHRVNRTVGDVNSALPIIRNIPQFRVYSGTAGCISSAVVVVPL